ncbi:MAG TPA: phosphate ABC transporter permease PstA [Geminicoccaceae bacterium]
MTDIPRGARPTAAGWSNTDDAAERVRRRHAADRRLRRLGAGAIAVAIGLLVILLSSIVISSWTAWTTTQIRLDVTIDPGRIDADDPFRGRYQDLVREAVYGLFPEVESAADQRPLRDLISNGAQFEVRERVVENPGLVGKTVSIWVPASDSIDQLRKGVIDRELPPGRRRVSDRQIAYYDALVEQGRVRSVPNTTLFTAADSRFPELAGLEGALKGSFYLLLITALLSVPMGVAAAVYLEEFAPKNRWTDLIEVNINNLAAVPSIVFGLLGLAVFLGFFGLPRSAPLVGGMVLSLMTLPTIIIATRSALKAVPPSIREAALGVGASHLQMVGHHVLPLAMPGILTGAIIGMAQALGETAPLLLIGMNAFITAAPEGVTSPSTALPTQIFIWFDSPERGFVARTSAAIVVLLGFLILMNALAVFLRRRFERKW